MEGGCEDPRVVEDSAGTYYMTYTAFDGTLARLMVASSLDLLHWTKHGPAFGQAYNGKVTLIMVEIRLYCIQLSKGW